MVKTTKRSRKFNAKTGGASKALEKKGASLTKKGKTKRSSGNKAKGGDGADKHDKNVTKGAIKEEEERERSSKDFTNTDGLGALDMDSFFEKAVGMAEDDDGSDSDNELDNVANKNNATKNGDGDEDDSSVDSYTSLGSEEEDIMESEARMKRQLEKLSQKDPEFHKYLKDNESSLLEYGEDEDYEEEEGEGYVQDEDAMAETMADMLGEDDEGVDANASGDAAMKAQFKAQQKAAANKFLLTPLRLQQLEQGAFSSHSTKGLKRIVGAYRTACHLSDANRQDEEVDSDEEDAGAGGSGGGSGGGGRKKKEFQITSPVVFDRLMAVCLVQCHEEFYYHLLGDKKEGEDDESSSESGSGSESGSDEEDTKKKSKDKPHLQLDDNKPLHPKTIAKSPHYPTLKPLLESFLKSTLHILSEAGKEAKLLQFVLSALAKYVPYLSCFPKLSKPYLKTCVKLWSAPLDTSEEYNAVRLQAFLRIRQLAVTQPYPFIEETLKLTYLSYAQRSKFGTASSLSSILPTLTFMGNCIVELYNLDYASSYQHAFVYIRQLALHLRSALMKRTEESMGVVTCWQFVHCLKLWVAVLCASCGAKTAALGGEDDAKLGGGAGKDEEANLLRSLVYPLTEIILGVCRLVPVARFAPLRLHCVRLLQQLAASTETFIPTTSLLLGILDLKEVGMKPLRDGGGKKGGKKNKSANTVRGLRLPLILKLPKENTLRTMEQVDAVLKEVFVLLNREVDLYRYSPGFPEFTFAIVQRLRKFNKEISNGRWRAYSKGTMELCEKYSTFAINGRATLADAPKDVRRLEALKPANTPSMRARYEAAVAKEKRLEAVTQPMMKTSKQKADGEGGKGKNDGKGKRKKMEEEEDGANERDVDSEEEEEAKKAKKAKPQKKNKKAAVVNEADLKNVESLKEEDEVKEGIAWSDSEESD